MSSGLLILVAIYLLVVLAVCGLLAIPFAILTYNRFVKLQTTVRTDLSNIDIYLKKRYDLIPALVETVRGYAGHENTTLARVTEMRARAVQAESVEEKAAYESLLQGLVKGLYAVAEDYPDLKADQNFRRLQEAISTLEDEIELARREYNSAVRDYNVLLRSFPANLIGRTFKFEVEPFFVLEPPTERGTQPMDFTPLPPAEETSPSP